MVKRLSPENKTHSLRAYEWFDGTYFKKHSELLPDKAGIIEYAKIKDFELVLDIGSGVGRHTKNCIKRGALVISLDFSPSSIKVLKRLIKRSISVLSDATRLPFRYEIFDKALCIDLLHNLSYLARETLCSELSRVLKFKGKAILSEIPNKKASGFRALFRSVIYKDPLIFMGILKSLFKRPFFQIEDYLIADGVFYHYFTLSEIKKIFERSGVTISRIRPWSEKSSKVYCISDFIKKNIINSHTIPFLGFLPSSFSAYKFDIIATKYFTRY